MTTKPVVFMDTETTGLTPDDHIWEFAGIRREIGPDQNLTERELHLFIQHDALAGEGLPEPFLSDYKRRFPPLDATPAPKAFEQIAEFTHGAHIVGAVPNFDTDRIARAMISLDVAYPGWHYHLCDVENLAVGFLTAKLLFKELGYQEAATIAGIVYDLPWDSNDLSLMVGVNPRHFARHTAMGDAQWAMAIYDAIMGDPH